MKKYYVAVHEPSLKKQYPFGAIYVPLVLVGVMAGGLALPGKNLKIKVHY